MVATPVCGICGKPKMRGTITYNKYRQEPFWMCGTLQQDHDDILAAEADVDWEEDEDEDEWLDDDEDWED